VIVAGYEIGEELGRGGMGAVLRARRVADGRDVAIKVLHRNAPGSTIARFERERRLLASFGEAEGFVPLLEQGETAEGPFLVMPFLAGGTLRERLKRGPLAIGDSIALARTLAAALGRAHARGIVHRDVKPENVIFTGDGLPLLADLGLGKHYDRTVTGASLSVALSLEGQTVGTPQYMAPEQALAGNEVGPSADVFSLGAVLYECLAGTPVFVGDSAVELFARMTTGNYEPLRDVRPDAPAWVDAVVRRALLPEPARRFADGAALASALAAPARRLAIVPALAAVAVLSAAGLGLGGWKAAPPPLPPRVAPVAPVASAAAPPPRPPPARTTPVWFDALREGDRPALPLPRGVRFGDGAGEYVNEADGSVLIFVAGGTFMMGSERDPRERPCHEVRLSPFFLGKYELSVGQFEAFARATSFVTMAERDGGSEIAESVLGYEREAVDGASFRLPFGGSGTPSAPNLPVTQVSWDDATAYCAWAGLSLPTEAQWERAAAWNPARKESRRFAWGEAIPGPGTPLLANLADRSILTRWPRRDVFDGYDDGFAGAAPVGSFPAGASPSGALDMTGNVSEWIRDAFEITFYATSRGATDPCFDPPSGMRSRVYRGDSYLTRPRDAALTTRYVENPAFRFESVGFRVARSGR
jgi:serine/threonine-protein kinase